MEQFGNRMDFFKKTTDEAPEECISRAVNDPTPFGRLDLQLWEVGRARNQNHWALCPFMEDPYFRCYYIAEGRGKLRTLDGSFPLEPGDLYLIPANYLFAYELDGPPPAHYWLHFSSELLDKLPGCREPAGTPADVSEEMERLLELASAPVTPAAAQEMDLLMRRLLAPLLLKVTENWNGEFHSGAFADSIDYIKRNFRHDIAIPELAARAGTDRDSFSRGFRQAVGMSPKSYLIQTRINHARMLLLRTGMTAREIAREVGYHDEFFFYRLFRKRVGMTPTGYRELNNALR